MPLTLEVPDDLAASLEASWRDLSKETLQALAIEAYIRGDLSAEEVQLASIPDRCASEEPSLNLFR